MVRRHAPGVPRMDSPYRCGITHAELHTHASAPLAGQETLVRQWEAL